MELLRNQVRKPDHRNGLRRRQTELGQVEGLNLVDIENLPPLGRGHLEGDGSPATTAVVEIDVDSHGLRGSDLHRLAARELEVGDGLFECIVECIEPLLEAAEEDRIEIAGGPSVQTQAQLYRDAALDDEHGLAGGIAHAVKCVEHDRVVDRAL
jgi:hypothetical protein